MLLVYITLTSALTIYAITPVIDDSTSRARRAAIWNSSNVAVYDKSSQQCCIGKVFPIDANSNRRCCGKTRYDMTQQKCCQGVLYPVNPNLKCCGVEYYSPNDGICCLSHYTDKFNLVKFSQEIIGNEDVKANMHCCGLKLYNKLTQICCAKKRMTKTLEESFPNTKIENIIFHSNNTYKEQNYVTDLEDAQSQFTSMLINTPIFEIQDISKKNCPEIDLEVTSVKRQELFENIELTNVVKLKAKCNEEKFNMTTHVCCPTQTNGEFNFKGESKLYEKKSFITGCCGLEAFEFDQEICCNNRKVYKQNEEGSLQCCGDVAFDATKEKCCLFSDLVVPKESLKQSESCCGESKAAYNPKTQICCGGVVEYKENLDMQCCTGPDKKGVFYSDDTEICCKGTKHAVAPGKSCCGSELIDDKTQICCREKVHPKTSPNENCCGDKIYNSNTHVCCEYDKTIVVKKTPDDNRCCGLLPYNKDKEVCCSDSALGILDNTFSGIVTYKLNVTLLPKPTATSACCGFKIYDKNNARCCNGKICKSTNKKLKVCGTALYDPNELLCCQPHLYTQNKIKSRTCCGKNAYYPERQICCRGVIKDTKNPLNATCCYG